jgi:membrane glycosyltransferase
MTQTADGVLAPEAPSLTTPTGLQANADLQRRRALVFGLNLATYAALLGWCASVLAAGGWTIVDGLLLVCFAIGTPWTVVGFWNALVGLWLLHGVEDAIGKVAPYAAAGAGGAPVTVRTAILMTVRNEDPARAVLRLKTVKASVDATGEGAAFAYFVLSDSDDPGVAAAEEAAFAAWKAEEGQGHRIVYRRRAVNAGFKAGNVRDLCERWGEEFDLMLPLDADSLMSGSTIVRLVRMMQAHPRIGILQSLVVGLPSASAFARVFQFGMRHGMRAYTMGQAWWVADCGPFWGHNALVRVEPFLRDCELPVLPGRPPLGGLVLSHDQVEATLMRRAGYEVRVLPQEGGSWEENPPTMLDFAKRDVRWCQGNMQYLKLLDLPGLLPMSRFQLTWAILMFLGIPAWTLMIALAPLATLQAQSVPDFPATSAAVLYVTFLIMYLMPKLAGLVDVALTRGGIARYGGPLRFAASAVLELGFSFLQGAISTIRTTIFMTGLALGRSVVWGGQSRDAYGISWATAVRNVWPQTLFGLAVCGALLLVSPSVLLWSLPLTLGYLLAVPFCVLTADPAAGRAMQRLGLAAIPEDLAPPPEVAAVQGLR